MPDRFKAITWPFVALISVGLTAVVVLLVWAPDSAEARSVITAISTVLAALLTAAYTGARVDRVESALKSVHANVVSGRRDAKHAAVAAEAAAATSAAPQVEVVDDTGHTIGRIAGGQVVVNPAPAPPDDDPDDDPADDPAAATGVIRRHSAEGGTW